MLKIKYLAFMLIAMFIVVSVPNISFAGEVNTGKGTIVDKKDWRALQNVAKDKPEDAYNKVFDKSGNLNTEYSVMTSKEAQNAMKEIYKGLLKERDSYAPNSDEREEVEIQLSNIEDNYAGVYSVKASNIFKANEFTPDLEGGRRVMSGFTPVINIGLAVLCILLLVFIGVTTAVDMIYLTTPAVREFMAGTSNMGGDAGGGQGKPKWITEEAYFAIQSSGVGGFNNQKGGDSGFKNPIMTYFWKRSISYIAAGFVLAILIGGKMDAVTGSIIDATGGIIDLFTGN